MADNLIHSSGSTLTRDSEESLQSLRWPSDVVGSEDGVADVEEVFELLLVCLTPDYGPAMV